MNRPVDVPTTLMQYDGQLTLIAEMRDRLTECADYLANGIVPAGQAGPVDYSRELQNLVARAENVLRKNE